jgi:hypothetical protein
MVAAEAICVAATLGIASGSAYLTIQPGSGCSFDGSCVDDDGIIVVTRTDLRWDDPRRASDREPPWSSSR